MNVPLIIAAHGTRDAEGEAQSRQLVAMVAEKLAPTTVSVGYVELNEPGIDDAVAAALDEQGATPTAVVVPLMLGTGGHVRHDIPDAIEAAKARYADADVVYTEYLGHDPRLLSALHDRITAAVGDWDRRDAHVVLLGRGAKVAEANANHARLCRLMYEACEVASVSPAYSQVTRPGLPEALNAVYATGARHVVVAANLLFAGRLKTWMREQVGAWTAAHPDCEVRLADVIGPCDELRDTVIDRYREATGTSAPEDGSPAYLSGLVLSGRDVLMVGAGQVADRRVDRLLEAGARVTICSPTLSVKLARLVREGAVAHTAEPFQAAMLDGVWYCLAQTNDPAVNAQVAAACEKQRIFCVRADDARGGTAWTPATERVGGVSVAVLGQRDPRRSRRVRDAVLRELLG